MRGAVPALAVGDDFAIGRHACASVHDPQLVRALERAVRREVVRPLEMNRSRHRAASRGPDSRAAVLAIAPRIEYLGIWTVEPIGHVAPPGEDLLVAPAGPAGRRRLRRVLREGLPFADPGIETPVEDACVGMPEIFE